MPGNPADVGYQPQQVPNAILQGLINRQSPKAAGLSAFTQGLMPGINNAISQIGPYYQNKKFMDLMNKYMGQQTAGASMGDQSFPQGQQPGVQPPGTPIPQPFRQSMAQNTGLMNSPLSMGGNDPMGLFQ